MARCSTIWFTMLLGLLAGCNVPGPAPEPLSDAQVARIHDSAWVFDAHVDVVMPDTAPNLVGPDGLSKVSLPRLKAGGVDAVAMALAVSPGPRTPEGGQAAMRAARAKLQEVMRLIAASDEEIVLATSADSLVAAHEAGKKAILLSFQNARALAGEPKNVDSFYDDGVRIFALTHLGHNDFADSSRPLYLSDQKRYEPTEEHQGLSALGRAAIARINALGAVVDVSQLSKAATLAAIEASTTPVIASHSNVRALSDVSRNLSDEEIDRIGATGGVIHVAPFGAYLVAQSDPELIGRIKAARRAAGLPQAYSYPYELYWELPDAQAKMKFLTSVRDVLGPADVERLVDHIDYIVQRIGIDHVGIGTDFNHGSSIDGFDDASEAPNVTRALLNRGYSVAQVWQIWGGNFLRVLRAAQHARGMP